MARNTKRNRSSKPERSISVRSVRREEPDVRKLAQVLLRHVMAQAEVEAQAEHQTQLVTMINPLAASAKLRVNGGRDDR